MPPTKPKGPPETRLGMPPGRPAAPRGMPSRKPIPHKISRCNAGGSVRVLFTCRPTSPAPRRAPPGRYFGQKQHGGENRGRTRSERHREPDFISHLRAGRGSVCRMYGEKIAARDIVPSRLTPAHSGR